MKVYGNTYRNIVIATSGFVCILAVYLFDVFIQRVNVENYETCWIDYMDNGKIKCRPTCSRGSFSLSGMESCRRLLTCNNIREVRPLRLLVRGVVKNLLVEFDDLDWKKREWIKIYDDKLFLLFLVEHTLVWAPREDNPIRGGAKNLYWPALNFKPLVDKIGLAEQSRKPIEYLVDKRLGFTEYIDLKVYQEQDSEKQSASRDYPEVKKSIKKWTEYQDGQKILLTTPSVLVGYRVEVYRVEGTTQWYTAVIVSYNDNTRELTLTDDTVLEEHNEDPCLVQMKLIGDGVVESILKGENIGITPRRRTCNQQRISVPYSTRTRNQHSPTSVSTSRITASPTVQKKTKFKQGPDGLLDNSNDRVSGANPDSPEARRRDNCSVIVSDSCNKRRTPKSGKKREESDEDDELLTGTQDESESAQDVDSSDQEESPKNHKKNLRKQARPKRVNGLEEDCGADDDAKSPHCLIGSSSDVESISASEVRTSSPSHDQNVAVSVTGDMSKVERPLLDDSTKVAEGGRQSPASDPKTDPSKQIGRNGSPVDARKVESSKSVSPLVIERNDGLRVFCDPSLVNSKRHFDPLQQPANLMHPAGLSHTATAAYPRVPALPQHTRATTHLSPYGLTSALIPSHHISPGSPMEQSSIHSQAYRQLISQHPPLLAQYSSPVGIGMLWQQKFPLNTPSPNPWMVEAQIQEFRERERVMAAHERQTRIERERREEQDRIERERLEREKAEKEIAERQEKERRERERAERERSEQQERERLERERVQREAVQQHFEESLRLVNERQIKWNSRVPNSWNPNLPLIKPLPTSNVGRCSPVVTVHSHAIHPTDSDKDKREKISAETKERHNAIDRLRQDQERWMVLVQQRNEQAADLSHSQNFALSEQRPGSVHSKVEGYPVSRSSPHPSSGTSSSSKSGMSSSPITATSSAATAQPKPEASFSLYGYQPFQHTYITQAQLKAREESKNSSNPNNQTAPAGRQPNQSSAHNREKEGSIPFERSSTPGSSRTSTPGSQSSSRDKQQIKVPMHPMGSEHASPVYQSGVGSSGAFRPYEYTPPSPAPAHQNTSSPNLGSRIGASHFHHASPQQEPQNLVKGEPACGPTEGCLPQHQPFQRYESARSTASSSPSIQVSGYNSPYMTKNNIPATSSPHSYNLIQQGVVPNPLYTPSSNGPTTVPPCVTTVTHISHQATSPPLGQTYPRATSGIGITSGTPVCRSNVYPSTQGRISYTHSSNSNIQAGVNPSRTPTPLETNGRSHILTSGTCHKSPSPAHMHNLPMSHTGNPTPPPTGGRIPPPSTSPRLTQGNILFNRGVFPAVDAQCYFTFYNLGQFCHRESVQPLNCSNKRKPVRDGSSRKRQKTNDDQLMPPQLQPQYHITPSTTTISLSQGSSPILQTSAISHHGASQNSALGIIASEAPTLTPHTISPTLGSSSGSLESYSNDQNQMYDDKLLKIKQKAAGIPPSNSPNSKINDSPPKLSSCANLASPANSNTSNTPPVLVGAISNSSENSEEVVSSPAQTTANNVINGNSITTTTGSTNHTKLKKAWLQRHSENEDKRNPSDRNKVEVSKPLNNGNSPDNSTSSVNEKNLTSNIKETKNNDKVHGNDAKNSKNEGSKVQDDSTSSASETEQELKNIKRKTRVGRKQTLTTWNNNTNKRQKVTNDNNTNETINNVSSKREESRKKPSPPERDVSRRRGRKTKGRGSTTDDSKKKLAKEIFIKPIEKPSVAQLKRTGESFLQDGSCYIVAPKLPKCRECRMTPNQRNKKMANIFCRFYAFRKLRYGKNGTIVGAGFSEPSDATEQDLKLWLSCIDDSPPELDVHMSKYILSNMGSQFCEVVEQEKEAQRLHMSNDTTITWKRVLQGVRELCDVCDTTLFNFHWVCHKCGFVVCIDCYKARKSGSGKKSSLKGRDDYQWLLCSNKQAHEQEKLTMTQIIASTALWDIGKALHEVQCKWNFCLPCKCNNKADSEVKHSTNGICKQVMNAVTKCFTDKDQLQLNGCPQNKKGNVNGMTNLIKQEDGYSSESGSSPLSWLADVALNSSSKLEDESKSVQIKIKSEADDDDDDDDDDDKKQTINLDMLEDGLHDEDDSNENFSTLRELLIRPTGKGGNGNRSNRNSIGQGNVKTTLSGLISNIVEQRVKKLDKEGKQSSHYTRCHSKDCDSVRGGCLTDSATLYSDVPHSWLCNGKLLLLKDPENDNNIKLFQEQWRHGEPIVITDVEKKIDLSNWHPENLCQEFGDIRNDIINCKNGAVMSNVPMRKFWEGIENFNKRLKDDSGEHMLLKMKDWSVADDFPEVLPACFQELLSVLPLPQYTQRDGVFNLASHVPSCFIRPDLGPKMYNAYGSIQHPTKGTINIHVETSDTVNVMVYVGLSKEVKEEDSIYDISKTYDEGGCDLLMKKRLKEKGIKPGALWHIYHAQDADKINEFLMKINKDKGQDSTQDPLLDQTYYLDEELRNRLSQEYGVEGYAVVQCLGDAIFIPAGAPHQVQNLHNCVKISKEFVSPENISQCFKLIQKSQSSLDSRIMHEDKLQIKNIIYHAVKDALEQLQENDPEDYQT
ncbi:LOW QUALITY PROTEIN: probable JmjC domain-containing histone demethylation protein 2C [Centruroides vittatus]|uniref:LOW QUALITY PROTEIN: probable JmjC domain-containing histone demethylation protein 2C n=1 Tax=Centruroides vittatus TaxID=120091 RepID=UPI00350F1283